MKEIAIKIGKKVMKDKSFKTENYFYLLTREAFSPGNGVLHYS